MRKIITNRVCILALDSMYRLAMRFHEAKELHQYAIEVAKRLDIQPYMGPIEGYYAEDELLTAYFRWMRAIQETSASRRAEVEDLPSYQALLRVTSSRLYGTDQRQGSLLPRGIDALTRALDEVRPWTLNGVLDAAHVMTRQTGEVTLVGIAALSRDPIAVVATRESVVLYAEPGIGRAGTREKEFIWKVDPEIAERMMGFVNEFNRLFNEGLPLPTEENAEVFWSAYEANRIVGRCVRVGTDPSTKAHYHWAIHRDDRGELAVHEFWSEDLWTTQRFTALLDRDEKLSTRSPGA